MSTSHHDNPVQDPQPTSPTLKEEFGFKSNSKTERALKTLQRLSGLTTILSTSQLISMGFSLANDASSFNILSTSLTSASLILSLVLAYWSTETLKSEQERGLLAQDLNLETLNTGLFVALLVRAALSLVLIPNMLLQSDNVPLPLIELIIFFVFLSAAKTAFNHIKQSGHAMSSLIFFANIAMLSSALGLIYTALKLKAFPVQVDIETIYPSWNLNGFLKLGVTVSFTSFLVWLVNYKKWRVPSALTTVITGALVLSFTAFSISGYSNSNTLEKESAGPYLALNNLGMLSAVFGMLVFVGGSYFFTRHSDFIETNKKRNLAGFGILVSLVLVFVAARGLYWQPFTIQQSTSGFSDLKGKPQTTELWAWLNDALNSIQENLNNVNQNLANVHSVYIKSKKRNGRSNTTLTTPGETEVSEQAPELSALWESLDATHNSINATNQTLSYIPSIANSPGLAPPPPPTTKLWAWLADSLNTIQGHINTVNQHVNTIKQIYKNAQDLGLFSPTGSNAATPDNEEEEYFEDGEYDNEEYEEEDDSEATTQLWSLWRSVNETQKSINAVNEEISKIHQNSQNLTSTITPAQTTELWAWLADTLNTIQENLNTINQHVATIKQLHKNAQNLGLVPGSTPVPASNGDIDDVEDEDGEDDEEYEDEYEDEEGDDSEGTTQLWSLWRSVNKTQNSISAASKELSKIHQNASFVNTSAPQTTELWAWLADTLTTIQGHINTANQHVNTIRQIYKNAQDLGLFSPTGSNAATPDNEEEEYFEDGEYDNEEYEEEDDSEATTQLWSLWRSVNETQKSINSASKELSKIHQNSQNVSAPQTTELWAWLADTLNTIQENLNTINQHVATIKQLHKNAQNLGLVPGSTPVPASNGDVDDVEDEDGEEDEEYEEEDDSERTTQLSSAIQAESM